jgi:hypothetical protein
MWIRQQIAAWRQAGWTGLEQGYYTCHESTNKHTLSPFKFVCMEIIGDVCLKLEEHGSVSGKQNYIGYLPCNMDAQHGTWMCRNIILIPAGKSTFKSLINYRRLECPNSMKLTQYHSIYTLKLPSNSMTVN